LEKYKDLLSFLISKDNEQLKALDVIKKFWAGSNFHTILYIGQLETYKIIGYKNIVNWVFKEIEKEEDSSNNFKLYWDVLFSIIQKVLGRSDLAKIELKKVRICNEGLDLGTKQRTSRGDCKIRGSCRSCQRR
jgi:MIF4G like.